MEKRQMETVEVFVDFCPDSFFHYSKFAVTDLENGNSYILSGFYDGDMCEDIRLAIKQSTLNGTRPNVRMILSKKDFLRWVRSYRDYIEHYS